MATSPATTLVPLFPLAGRVLARLGLSPAAALVAISWAGGLATFVLLHRLVRRFWGYAAALWSLLALAAFPGFLYLLIGFPYSLALALGIGAFLALLASRPWLARILALLPPSATHRMMLPRPPWCSAGPASCTPAPWPQVGTSP